MRSSIASSSLQNHCLTLEVGSVFLQTLAGGSFFVHREPSSVRIEQLIILPSQGNHATDAVAESDRISAAGMRPVLPIAISWPIVVAAAAVVVLVVVVVAAAAATSGVALILLLVLVMVLVLGIVVVIVLGIGHVLAESCCRRAAVCERWWFVHLAPTAVPALPRRVCFWWRRRPWPRLVPLRASGNGRAACPAIPHRSPRHDAPTRRRRTGRAPLAGRVVARLSRAFRAGLGLRFGAIGYGVGPRSTCCAVRFRSECEAAPPAAGGHRVLRARRAILHRARVTPYAAVKQQARAHSQHIGGAPGRRLSLALTTAAAAQRACPPQLRRRAPCRGHGTLPATGRRAAVAPRLWLRGRVAPCSARFGGTAPPSIAAQVD